MPIYVSPLDRVKYYKVKPVLPCVDVEVGEDEGVEGTLLCRPLHHRLEPVLQEQDGKSFAKHIYQTWLHLL